jgi:copper chaperone CopZ
VYDRKLGVKPQKTVRIASPSLGFYIPAAGLTPPEVLGHLTNRGDKRRGSSMVEEELRISGMTCHHCVMAVKKELAKVPGLEVKDVQIGSARVAYDRAHVTMAQLEAAVAEAGYALAH